MKNSENKCYTHQEIQDSKGIICLTKSYGSPPNNNQPIPLVKTSWTKRTD